MGKPSPHSKALSVKPDDNHGAKRPPGEEERRIERAFHRLGDILAEIATDLDREEGGSHQSSKGSEAQPELEHLPKRERRQERKQSRSDTMVKFPS